MDSDDLPIDPPPLGRPGASMDRSALTQKHDDTATSHEVAPEEGRRQRLETNRLRARERRKRDKVKWQHMQQELVDLKRENENLKRKNLALERELSATSQQGQIPPGATGLTQHVVRDHTVMNTAANPPITEVSRRCCPRSRRKESLLERDLPDAAGQLVAVV
mmetsp:Transcript_61146/g.180857  ORF Transcript_61146/g.180857 Transcript_61146/m.180857 type:complete len:163 (-) Transcript_61146:1054-1542(-)